MTDPIISMMECQSIHLNLQSQYQALGFQVNIINTKLICVVATEAVLSPSLGSQCLSERLCQAYLCATLMTYGPNTTHVPKDSYNYAHL